MKTLKISIILTFFSLLTWIIFQMMQPTTPTTPAAPTAKKLHCEIVQIQITTPAGYTVNEAMRAGKILEIIW